MLNAVQDGQDRLPGLATFLATGSGLSLLGISSAFWGLVLGLLVHQIFHARWSQTK
jgi:benzoate membrane transport protein